jgi:ABC-type arginine transport system permease subunit
VNPFIAGTLTLGFIFGAYLTETFRGAILAIPRGQIEAGHAFGLAPLTVLRRITLPQMVRHAIPGFANNWLVMVKATALISIIGLDDMVHRANLASSATNKPFTFFAAIGLVYLAVTTVSIGLLTLVERRFSLGVRKADL